MAITSRPSAIVLLGTLLIASCAEETGTGEDAKVTTLGSIEVRAELAEIRGEFVNKPLYDYAFIMKYRVLQVHRGALDGDFIYVGHYNPLKPRNTVADARVPEIGGNLEAFHTGGVHRMALEVPIEDHYMGGIINRYFDEGVEPLYWAVWTNRAAKP